MAKSLQFNIEVDMDFSDFEKAEKYFSKYDWPLGVLEYDDFSDVYSYVVRAWYVAQQKTDNNFFLEGFSDFVLFEDGSWRSQSVDYGVISVRLKHDLTLEYITEIGPFVHCGAKAI